MKNQHDLNIDEIFESFEAENTINLLKKLKKDIFKILGQDDTLEIKQSLRSLNKTIDETYRKTVSTKKLDIHLNSLSPGIHRKLLRINPDLQVADLRLCQLIILNLDNNEISELMGISPSSVSMKKSRLKKKLGIHQNLHTFLLELEYNE